ncbi:HAD family hydrolase, partial [Klebsiella pneumoniae]
ELLAAAHAGMTSEEFDRIVADWLAKARHPRFGRPYTELTYLPMLELLAYLRAHGFKTYIVSGGGVEFMRPWTERAYGIPPEQVIGSAL